MEELKKKQASLQKDRAAATATDIRHIIHRPPAVPSFVGPGTGKRRSVFHVRKTLGRKVSTWSSLVEGGEGSYLPNCQTTLVIALLLFCIFINTTAYHLGRYEPSPPSTKELHGIYIFSLLCIFKCRYYLVSTYQPPWVMEI